MPITSHARPDLGQKCSAFHLGWFCHDKDKPLQRDLQVSYHAQMNPCKNKMCPADVSWLYISPAWQKHKLLSP